jgi:hypothetical protein
LVEGDAGDRSLLATGLATSGDRSGDFLKKKKIVTNSEKQKYQDCSMNCLCPLQLALNHDL